MYVVVKNLKHTNQYFCNKSVCREVLNVVFCEKNITNGLIKKLSLFLYDFDFILMDVFYFSAKLVGVAVIRTHYVPQ